MLPTRSTRFAGHDPGHRSGPIDPEDRDLAGDTITLTFSLVRGSHQQHTSPAFGFSAIGC
jgi:hypothetical protein